MNKLELQSYAKINLGLLLVNKREDGYHNILTVFQQIDLHDVLVFQKTSGEIILTSSDKRLPLNDENLIWKAFVLFRRKAGIRDGLNVHIEKNIPVGGGLGGGSSNAATTLTAANRMWGNLLTKDELLTMALELGSDVPFFLMGGTAKGEGRGEVLHPLACSFKGYIVLLCPGIHISTEWAYRKAKINLTKDKKITNFNALLKNPDFHDSYGNLNNDFESVVFQRHPVLEEYKEQLVRKGAFYAGMSGSGSSVYGLFQDRGKAKAAQMFFSEKYEISSHLCRPLMK